MRRTKTRASRLQRLLRAQRALLADSEAQTARARAELADLRRSEHEIVKALSGDTPLHGFAVDAMAAALSRNARQAAKGEVALSERVKREKRVAAELKVLGERAARARVAAAREDDRERLAEAIDGALMRSAFPRGPGG